MLSTPLLTSSSLAARAQKRKRSTDGCYVASFRVGSGAMRAYDLRNLGRIRLIRSDTGLISMRAFNAKSRAEPCVLPLRCDLLGLEVSPLGSVSANLQGPDTRDRISGNSKKTKSQIRQIPSQSACSAGSYAGSLRRFKLYYGPVTV